MKQQYWDPTATSESQDLEFAGARYMGSNTGQRLEGAILQRPQQCINEARRRRFPSSYSYSLFMSTLNRHSHIENQCIGCELARHRLSDVQATQSSDLNALV